MTNFSFLAENAEISILNTSISIGTLMLVFFGLLGTKRVARKLLKKTPKSAEKRKKFLGLMSQISLISTIIFAFFFASLTFPFSKFLHIIFAFLFVIAILIEVKVFVQFFLEIIMAQIFKHQDEKTQKNLTEIVNTILQVIIWIFTIMIVFDSIGVQITPLLASLGVGGIAVAFAAQKLLEDFFSSFSIMGSSPFRIGDIITVNNYTGTVQQIGLRSTTIQTFEGKSIVIPNRILVANIIENSGMIKSRRKRFSLTVTYQTPVEKLRKIPKLLEEIITKEKNLTFERAMLRDLQASALEILVSYVVESEDRLVATQAHNDILLKILEIFEKEGIEFAYPTQTLYLKKEE